MAIAKTAIAASAIAARRSGAVGLAAIGLVYGTRLDRPAVSQEQMLAASGLAYGSRTARPALGQTHELAAATPISYGTRTGSPALGQTHALAAATGLAFGTRLGSPTVAIVGAVLDAVPLSFGTLIGVPVLGQIHALAATSISFGTRFQQAEAAAPYTFSRSTSAWADSLDGTWVEFAADAPAITDRGLVLQSAGENFAANPDLTGVVAGAPGTAPTGWIIQSTSNGLTREIVADGTVNGLHYFDLRYHGTTTANNFTNISFTAASAIPLSVGDTVASSVFMALVGGSFANLNAGQPRLRVALRRGDGSYLTELPGHISLEDLGPDLQRVTQIGLNSNAEAAAGDPLVQFTYPAGVEIDLTLRFAWPQLEKRSEASPTLFDGVRPADALTLTLPPGAHDVVATLDDGSTQLLASGQSGDYAVDPAALSRPRVKRIVAGSVWDFVRGAYYGGPSLRQDHGLAARSLKFGTRLAAPALVHVLGLEATPISYGTRLAIVPALQGHVLAATPLAFGSRFGQPALSQEHILLAPGLKFGTRLDTPYLSNSLIFVNRSGSWLGPQMFVRRGGAWVEVDGVWINRYGEWHQLYF